LLSGDRVLDARAEEMSRGQAERLMPLLQDMLVSQSLAWRDLGRIGVGIGPGNFTGIRISVSLARGLALGLGIPAIGVSTLDSIRADYPGGTPCVPAPRGQAYIQPDTGAPRLVPLDEIEHPVPAPAPADLAVAIARLAVLAPADGPPPAPLYVRPADAAPSREAPPRILDDA
jgi:tRNA threonylcarbamoyl adenosine modification protein YeaZ